MYEILKNRLSNGKPFLRARALAQIAKVSIDITPEQVDELIALAEANGVEVLPTDALGRLDAVEAETDDLTLLIADLLGGTY